MSAETITENPIIQKVFYFYSRCQEFKRYTFTIYRLFTYAPVPQNEMCCLIPTSRDPCKQSTYNSTILGIKGNVSQIRVYF